MINQVIFLQEKQCTEMYVTCIHCTIMQVSGASAGSIAAVALLADLPLGKLRVGKIRVNIKH